MGETLQLDNQALMMLERQTKSREGIEAAEIRCTNSSVDSKTFSDKAAGPSAGPSVSPTFKQLGEIFAIIDCSKVNQQEKLNKT